MKSRKKNHVNKQNKHKERSHKTRRLSVKDAAKFLNNQSSPWNEFGMMNYGNYRI